MGMRLYCDMCDKKIGNNKTFYAQYTYECEEGKPDYHDTHPTKITICEECIDKYYALVEKNEETVVDCTVSCYAEMARKMMDYCDKDPEHNIPKVQEAFAKMGM